MKHYSFYLTALAVALSTSFAFTSCSDDEESSSSTDFSQLYGTYNGYSSADFQYSTGYVTGNDTITITGNEDGTAIFAWASDSWGTYVDSATVVTATETGYAFKGSGTTTLSSHSGSSTSYAFTFSGSIDSSREKLAATLVVTMGDMGEVTITFVPGELESNSTNETTE